LHGDPSLGEERFGLCFFVRGRPLGFFSPFISGGFLDVFLESLPRLDSDRHASMVIRFAHPFGAALRPYDVLRLFIGAELNDLDGVSVLLKKPELFWVCPSNQA